MKLAEALLERKSLMEKIAKLRERATQNALVQEGDTPAELPAALLSELAEAVAQLEVVIQRINATNNVAKLPAGATVSYAIVHRDMLNLQRSAVEQVATAAGIRHNLYSRSEVKFVATVEAAVLRKQVDALAQEWRELDAQIQAVNWNTELQ